MKWLKEFIQLEAASGVLLVIAAALAMILANSPLAWLYDGFLNIPVMVQVGELVLQKPLLLWINDGLMAIFFLLIGLEVKREMLEGELSSKEQILLPAVGAVGGMAIPALIYLLLNGGDPVAVDGWAIPTATDIAFALGVIALLGPRIPPALRIFLLALAIFDDLGAIIIIALFYSADISTLSLGLAALFITGLAILNFRGVTRLAPYILLGIGLWIAVLKSGVHATLAGVVLGLFIPLRPRPPKNGAAPRRRENDDSPLRHLEHILHPWVAFFIMPLFAFSNAGVALGGFQPAMLLDPIPMGIWAGLFLGKQVGIFTLCGLVIRLGWATLPQGVSWSGFYGISALCGIGFTMSLFITSLAFEHSGAADQISADRLGILVGTFLSALVGYGVLRLGNPARSEPS